LGAFCELHRDMGDSASLRRVLQLRRWERHGELHELYCAAIEFIACLYGDEIARVITA
jgi:hypothetical protein